jgi:hypothetical protein
MAVCRKLAGGFFICGGSMETFRFKASLEDFKEWLTWYLETKCGLQIFGLQKSEDANRRVLSYVTLNSGIIKLLASPPETEELEITIPPLTLLEEFNPEVVSHIEALKVGIQERWPQSARKKRIGAPPLEERVDVEEKRKKAQEYRTKVEAGVPKEVAAQLIGHSRKTLERWVGRLL